MNTSLPTGCPTKTKISNAHDDFDHEATECTGVRKRVTEVLLDQYRCHEDVSLPRVRRSAATYPGQRLVGRLAPADTPRERCDDGGREDPACEDGYPHDDAAEADSVVCLVLPEIEDG